MNPELMSLFIPAVMIKVMLDSYMKCPIPKSAQTNGFPVTVNVKEKSVEVMRSFKNHEGVEVFSDSWIKVELVKFDESESKYNLYKVTATSGTKEDGGGMILTTSDATENMGYTEASILAMNMVLVDASASFVNVLDSMIKNSMAGAVDKMTPAEEAVMLKVAGSFRELMMSARGMQDGTF